MDFLASNRFVVYAVVAISQAFLLYRLWRLPRRGRRAMLIAYIVAALVQSTASVWLSISRDDSNAPFSSTHALIFYISFAASCISWALCFGVVHEILNSFLAPYEALQAVGQRCFRAGMGVAVALVLSSALIAPSKTRDALTFVFRSEPLLIYGSVAALLIGVVAFVWHFQLDGSANDRTAFALAFLLFTSFTLSWALQQIVGGSGGSGVGGVIRMVIAIPILVGAGLRFSSAGDAVPLQARGGEQRNIRRTLEKLNASLERVVKS